MLRRPPVVFLHTSVIQVDYPVHRRIINENVSQDAVENIPENSPNDDIMKELNDVNLEKDFPTDRGHFPGDISDAALERTIIEHGPCRSKDPKYFSSRDEKKQLFFRML